jgi:hypothetical protein
VIGNLVNNHVVGMPAPPPQRSVRRSKRAIEASQVLPTPASTVPKRRRLYRDPNDDDDLDGYIVAQVIAMQLPSSPLASPPLMAPVLDTQPPFTQAVLQVPLDESSEPDDNEGTEPEQPEVPEKLLSDRDEEVDKQDDEQPSVESGWFLQSV